MPFQGGDPMAGNFWETLECLTQRLDIVIPAWWSGSGMFSRVAVGGGMFVSVHCLRMSFGEMASPRLRRCTGQFSNLRHHLVGQQARGVLPSGVIFRLVVHQHQQAAESSHVAV